MGINLFEEIKTKLYKNLENRKISLSDIIFNMSKYLDDLDSQITSYYNLYHNQLISANTTIDGLKKRKAIFITNNENQLRIIKEKKNIVENELAKRLIDENKILLDQLNKKNNEINENYKNIFDEIEKNNNYNDIVYTKALRNLDNEKKNYEDYYNNVINEINLRFVRFIDRIKKGSQLSLEKLENTSLENKTIYEEKSESILRSVAENVNKLNNQSKMINDNYLKYSSNTNNLFLQKNEEFNNELTLEKENINKHLALLQEQAKKITNTFNDNHKQISYNYTVKINEVNSTHYRLIDENNKKISDIQRKIKELSYSDKVNEQNILRLNNAIKRINAYKVELNRKYNAELNYINNLRTFLTKRNTLQYNTRLSVINQSITTLEADLTYSIKKKTSSYSYSLAAIDNSKTHFNELLNADFNIISNRAVISQTEGEIYKKKLDFDLFSQELISDQKHQILELKTKYYIEKTLLIKKSRLDKIYIEKKMLKDFFENYITYYQLVGENKKEQNQFELRLYGNNRSYLKRKASKDYNDQYAITMLANQTEVDRNTLSSINNSLSTIAFTFKNDQKIKQKLVDELCDKYQILLNNTTNFAKYYIEFFIYNLLTIKDLVSKSVGIISLRRILGLALEASNIIKKQYNEILNNTIDYINDNFLVDIIKNNTTYYGYISSLLDLGQITKELNNNIEKKYQVFDNISKSNLDNEDYEKAKHLFDENKKIVSDLEAINFDNLLDLNTIDYSLINNLKDNIISLSTTNVLGIIELESSNFAAAYTFKKVDNEPFLQFLDDKTKHLYDLIQNISTIETFIETDITSMKNYANNMYDSLNEKYIHITDSFISTLKQYEENTSIFNDLLVSLRTNITNKTNNDLELDHDKKIKSLIESNNLKQSNSKIKVDEYFNYVNDQNLRVNESNKLIDANYSDSLVTIKRSLEAKVAAIILETKHKISEESKIIEVKKQAFDVQIEKNEHKIDYFVKSKTTSTENNRKILSKRKEGLFSQYLLIQAKQSKAKKELKEFKNLKDQILNDQINKLKKSLKITKEEF